MCIRDRSVSDKINIRPQPLNKMPTFIYILAWQYCFKVTAMLHRSPNHTQRYPYRSFSSFGSASACQQKLRRRYQKTILRTPDPFLTACDFDRGQPHAKWHIDRSTVWPSFLCERRQQQCGTLYSSCVVCPYELY